jgi:hypothetical protein
MFLHGSKVFIGTKKNMTARVAKNGRNLNFLALASMPVGDWILIS